MAGKWHNGAYDMRYHPIRRGFDEVAAGFQGSQWYYDWRLDYNGKTIERADGRYLTDVLTSEAVSFIERYRHEPFLYYLAYNAPHGPHEAPKDEITPYRETGKLTDKVSTIYAMITRMDNGVGRLLDTLSRLGLDENTILLFTSDNGPQLREDTKRYNGPFRGEKQDVLEGGIRVPAVLRWPAGLPPAVTVLDMVHFHDWLPTLLRLSGCNVEPKLPFDGEDISPVLRGEGGTINCLRFWQFNRYDPVMRCNGAMRDGSWKLNWPRIPEAMTKLSSENKWVIRLRENPAEVMDVDFSRPQRKLSEPGPPELFNLDNDPDESTDRAREYPECLAKMKQQYEKWFEEVNGKRLKFADNLERRFRS